MLYFHRQNAASKIDGPAQATIAAAEPQMAYRATKTHRHAPLSPIMATPDDLIGAPDRPSKVPDGSDGSNWLLNDAQITGIERRLRLTREQAPYWPAVAAALRDVAGQLCQQPAGAAVDRGRPFLQQLRDDQKREVRELVRMIGLGTVSSHI
jgi:hypothetical protein